MSPAHWSPRVTKDMLESKCRFFVNMQLWPIESKLDARGWLKNFTHDEQIYASHLLNSFVYFSRLLTERLFIAAIANLGTKVVSSKRRPEEARRQWIQFINSAYFVGVRGEFPNDSDSGYLFSRMARQVLEVEEERIVGHEQALAAVAVNRSVPVIFVDDFVGSGLQFKEMWRRRYPSSTKGTFSFESIAGGDPGNRFYYCPLIATSDGYEEIRAKCSGVVLSSAHVIDERYSALSPVSILWPEELRDSAPEFLQRASLRAGIPDTNGGEDDWRGFHKQGLALAFEHGPPDATLPLFYWEQNGWRPLLRRA